MSAVAPRRSGRRKSTTFATDYAFRMQTDGAAPTWLDDAPISSDDKEKIGGENAARC